MLNLITGLIIGLVFFLCLAAAFYYGYWLGKQVKDVKKIVDEDAKKKAEQFQKSFNAMMNYDVNKALQRRRVING